MTSCRGCERARCGRGVLARWACAADRDSLLDRATAASGDLNESHDEAGVAVVTSSQFDVDENSALLLVADVTAPEVLLTHPGDVLRVT